MLSAPAALHAQADTRHGGGTAKSKEAADDPGPLLAIVSLSRQRILVYGRSGLLAQSRVSTGMRGHRTPAGVFSILQRSRHHRSNIYSNAPMPYMQRLTWSGVALHAGVVPHYPASHGCIRLPFPFAAKLWGMAKLGTPVIVAPDDAAAVAIEHPRLPAPRFAPAPPDDVRRASGEPHGPTLASAAGATATDAAAEPGLAGGRPLSPLQRARALKARAKDDAAATIKAARLAATTARARAAEASHAAKALRDAERTLAAARRRHEDAVEDAKESALERARASERAKEALAAADAALGAARATAEEARLIDVVCRDAAARADAAEVRRAAKALQDAERTLAAARRRHEDAVEAAEESALEQAQASERAKKALAAAEAALGAARATAAQARLLDAVRTDAADAAAAARVYAENAHRAAVAALRATRRIEEPISILVSRREGRVYVRQAWKEIHEAPVTFTDGPLLGTHVYVAVGPAADGEALSWLTVSLPPSARARARLRREARQEGRAAEVSGLPPETAAGALDRFELPEATRRFIGDRLWAGATLIVSDSGISHETGDYTDFIVLTR